MPILIESIVDDSCHRIPSIDGLQLVGDSQTMVVSFESPEFDVFMVSDAMHKRGWSLNALQNPNSVHICCTYKHVGKADVFLEELRESVAEVRKNPEVCS
jgi:sphinganine-1-phosphate aldolase